MRVKFIIILLLLGLLAYVIYLMMQHETTIRRERVTTEVLEDDTGPLIEKLPDEQLRRMASESDYYFRTGGDYMEKLTYGYRMSDLSWEPFLIKGVNMGVALPGKFPAEFAMTYDEYMDWFIKVGEMNANSIRVYTILPPEFYEAFSQYNLNNQDNPIYLFHGVWATVPDEDDYMDADYTRSFKEEIIDVIDVLHGNAMLEPERGKASGVYAIDVSRYVGGIMFGREWEPNTVFLTNQNHDVNHYYGDFVSMPQGSPMEVWLAEIIDFTVLYKTQTYQMQHPVSFVNWLPLDPMFHNTEFIESDEVREYDNDLESVSFNNFHSHETFIPGIYASYHAYPYYPDYVYLKDEYANSRNKAGNPDNYYGYLKDLKAQYEGMPLIIAEYGVPSSRGNSHVTPLGFDQGGLSEAEQAGVSMILTRDIFDTGCAGALYFAWSDEWFKHNWLVMDFEIPFHDRKYWHNMENPEQNFGILAQETRERTIDGSFDDWPAEFSSNHSQQKSFHADPAYFYMAWRLNQLDFEEHNLYIAIDTYDKQKGSHRLPFTEERFDRGFEFLMEFFGQDSAQILVDEPYSVFTDIYNDSIPAYASKPNEAGNFVPQHMLTNRGRESLTGEKFDPVIVNRGRLQHGKSNQPKTSNADWYFNEEKGQLEIRLTWHLLNVTNPAKNYVLDNRPGTGRMDYTKTGGFNMIAFITDKDNNVITRYPKNGYADYLWDGWEEPDWSSRLKPLYDSLRYYFRDVETQVSLHRDITFPDETALSIAPWYQNKEGAVSVSFRGADHSQVVHALPVLDKYGISATFGVIPDVIDEPAGQYQIDEAGRRKRFSRSVLEDLAGEGHSLALQSSGIAIPDAAGYDAFMQNIINMNHVIAESGRSDAIQQGAELFRTYGTGKHQYAGVNWYSHNNPQISQTRLDSLLTEHQHEWLIFTYQYLSESSDPEKGDSLFITPERFERQVRLARNHQYWLANEWDVFRYRTQRKHSDLEVSRHNDRLFVSLDSPLDPDVYNHPLTIRFETNAPLVQLTGDEGEYTLTNRKGVLYFDLLPGTELILYQIW